MHSQCPKDKEWSALLIYKITEGNVRDFTDPENKEAVLEITAEALFPMDYGDATFTSFEGSEDWLKCFDLFPQIDPMNPQENWFIGKIHSHHHMPSFHSGTDNNDLYENAPKLPMFLSLVVNYNGMLDCKLAIAMESEEVTITKSSWKLSTWSSRKEEVKEVKNPTKMTYVIECSPFYLQEQWLIDQCDALTARPKSTYMTRYTPPVVTTLKHDTPAEAIIQKACYKLVLEDLGELIALGAYEGTPFSAYDQADTAMSTYDRQKYIDAFKYYFAKRWYNPVFGMTPYSANQVLAAIQEFIDHHKTRWIHGPLTQAIKELGNEWYTYWAVQRSSVV